MTSRDEWPLFRHHRPNNSMQQTALRAAAEPERAVLFLQRQSLPIPCHSHEEGNPQKGR